MTDGNTRYRDMLIWYFGKTGNFHRDVEVVALNIWWLQTGMAIALKHPEYAQVWLATEPENSRDHWDFMEHADSFVESVPIEATL